MVLQGPLFYSGQPFQCIEPHARVCRYAIVNFPAVPVPKNGIPFGSPVPEGRHHLQAEDDLNRVHEDRDKKTGIRQ